MQLNFNNEQLKSIYSAIQCSLMDAINRKGDLTAGFCRREVDLDRFNAELQVYQDLIKHYEQILNEIDLCCQVNNY